MTYAEAVAATIREDVEGSADPREAAADYVGAALGLRYLVDGMTADYREAVRGVRITVTVGGPFATVTYRQGSANLTVDAVDGADTSTAWVHAPHVADALEALGDTYAFEVIR